MRLFFLIYSIAGPSLAGAGVIAALTAGRVGLVPILVAAALGAALAVPVAWTVAKRIA